MSMRLTLLSLYLLLLSIKIFAPAAAADSEHMESNTEECKKTSKTFDFEEAWPLLQTAVDTLINQFEQQLEEEEEEEEEESVLHNNKSIFTSDQYMTYYKTVYELCTNQHGDRNSELLYVQYKKVFDDYINSTVLPSLREKKDELLLREVLRRWSNHKIMTRWLFRFFRYLDRYYIPRWKLPSLEETSFLSFYDLVFGKMNKQVTDVILTMIDRERAGEQIDRTLVNKTLAFYSEIDDRTRKNNAKHFAEKMIIESAAFYYGEASHWKTSSSFMDNTPKQEEKLQDRPSASSKKIKLISSDGDVFEVDYDVALVSKTIEDIIKSNSVGDNDNIPVSLVSSKILAKVIEYCKKHIGEDMSDIDLKDWDAEFVEVDHHTLFDLVLSSNYLNIKSLLDLASSKIADMIKGKTPEEIRHIFNIKDDFT